MSFLDKWYFKKDKLLHFVAGVFLSQAVMLVASIFVVWWIALIASFVVSTAIMYGKELWDKAGHGVYEIKDFLIGEVGILYGLAMLSLLCLIH